MTDPTARALTLLGLLEGRPVWNGADLAERLDVTPRTVRRDIERLRNLGYRIDAERGADGGYALGRAQVLPPLLLDDEESLAVTLGLELLARSGDGRYAEPAERAAQKVDAVMAGPARHRAHGLREAMSIVPREPAALGELEACAETIRRQVQARFSYVDRHGEHTTRRVEPHRLVARGRWWKLVAFDLDRDAWRTFRLERVSEWREMTWRFEPRADLDDVLGGLDAAPPASIWRHEILVDIDAPIETVRESLTHLAGRLSALPDGRTRLLTGGDDPDEAALWIARIPFDFVVMGDGAAREAVAALGARLVRAGTTGDERG